jgi:hypothetical protein
LKPERTKAYKELKASPVELGRQLIDRWFVPEVWSEAVTNSAFLEYVGETLRTIGLGFPASDPDWDIPRWEDRLSVFDPYDLDRYGSQEVPVKSLWRSICETVNTDVLYLLFGVGVDIREYDFLVTTPVSRAREHIKEAEDAIELYRRTGEVDYYFRDCWPFPKNLRIGSKYFYVDRRAIRGFAVVTGIDIDNIDVNMNVNTWRWIEPIPCDYSQLKPPQRYARALTHQYFEGISEVQIIGGWLDPMPCMPKS